ncbi:MAG TPA: RNA polymerase sigma factor [Chloroflexota bacterium]|nr:RNA polymerase sigma factor [Chloroflexota bacterium]
MTLQELPTAKPTFEALYEQYHTRIVIFLNNRLRTDRADAEDLAHDAFLKMGIAWPGFEYRTAAGTDDWVFRVALNVLRDACRHRRLVKWGRFWDDTYGFEESVSAANLRRITSTDPLDDPQAQIASKAGLADLHRIIAALPPRQSAALSLFAVHGHSYEEIGEMLGLNRGGVKGLLWRARREFHATRMRDAITADAGPRQ